MMAEKLGTSLWRSIRSEKLADVLATATDAAVDAATSGALDGVPVVNLLVGMTKAGRSVRDRLYLRKVILFLQSLDTTTQEERGDFITSLEGQDELERFGETIVLILEQNDDMRKPGIIGRVVAAHIKGHVEYAKAMRLAAMVNRAYAADLDYLKTFASEAGAYSSDVAASLFSVGLLANVGMEMPALGQRGSAGTRYKMNEYGKLLVKYGLA